MRLPSQPQLILADDAVHVLGLQGILFFLLLNSGWYFCVTFFMDYLRYVALKELRSYFVHYLRVVMILLSTGLYKLIFLKSRVLFFLCIDFSCFCVSSF